MINIYYLIKDKSYLRLDRISASNYPRDNFIRYRDRPIKMSTAMSAEMAKKKTSTFLQH
jgi:hypothetical protein